MSYEVIARKWRPQRFDEVQGQSHATTALRNAIKTGRVPHALLLTGPRGVGKTTLARLLARCLNCDQGPTEEPCGECAPCKDIIAGRSTDVQEIDAASRTGVDDMREVIESIRYAASPGKHRIFVIDEVHMLSASAFNALLKTLEEPPPRSLFVFATTNPEKIPFTVLSRCQRYDLRRIPRADVAAHLGSICAAEGVKISESSLMQIAREGDGSMRDAQTLLDQIIAFGGTEVSDETVAQVLDLVDHNVLLDLARACIEGDAAAALAVCGQVADAGTDPKRLATTLVQLLRDLVVLRVAPKAEGLVEGSPEEIESLRALADATEPARLRRMFRALVKEQEDLAWAPQPFAVLEMAIVRLATLPAGDDVEGLLARLDQLDRKLAALDAPDGGGGGQRSQGGGGRPPSKTGAKAPAKPPAKPAAKASARPTALAPVEPRTETPARPADAGSPGVASVSSARHDARTSAPSSVDFEPPPPDDADAPDGSGAPGGAMPLDEPPPLGEPAPSAPVDVVFDRLKAFAQKRDASLFGALGEGRLIEQRAGFVKLALPGEFHVKRLTTRLAEVEAACAAFFGEPTRVEIVRTEDAGRAASPIGRAGADREADRQRRQTALNHPSINVALEVLEGEIVEIRALGAPRR